MVTRGMYATALQWWLDWFEPKDVLVINFDDVVDDIKGVVEKIGKFMGEEINVT